MQQIVMCEISIGVPKFSVAHHFKDGKFKT